MPGFPAAPSVQTVSDKLATISPTKGNVPGYYVWLVDPDANDESLGAQTPAPGPGIYGPSGATDAQGNWSIAGVPAGTYVTFFGSRSDRWEARGKAPYLVALSPPSLKGNFGIVNVVTDFGADPTGGTDSTTAIRNAITGAAALGKGSVVYFPVGTFKFLGQLAATDVKFWGEGISASTLQCTAQLGVGVPAVIFDSTNANGNFHLEPIIQRMHVKGPGSYSLGNRVASCDGIKLNRRFAMKEILVEAFDSNIVNNSDGGHCYFESVTSTNGYYGHYDISNTFDHKFVNCNINGNNFANFAAPGNVSIAGYSLVDCHIGFSPYAFYHESHGSPVTFLQDLFAADARFEAIGNNCILDENFATSGQAGMQGCVIINPGHSFNNTYKIAARAQDWAIKVGYCGIANYIWGGANPFLAGSSGVISINQLFAALFLFCQPGTNNSIGSHPEFVFQFPQSSGELQVGTGLDVSTARALQIGGTNATQVRGTGGSLAFADGGDGAVTLDGTTAVGAAFGTPAGNTYTMGRDAYCSSLTVNPGVTVNTNGWKIFCTGLLTNNGTIGHVGNAAAGATAGAIFSNGNSGQYPTSAGVGTAGGAGAVGAGTAGTNQGAFAAGGAGGAGGTSGANAGGAGGTQADLNRKNHLRAIPVCFTGYTTGGNVILAGAGGGSGGGDGTNAGGGGGGGAGAVCIAARVLNNAGIIRAKGGAGGNGAAGNASGGGGGGGGYLVVIYGVLVAAGTLDVTGGAAGTSQGTGGAASAGSSGTLVQIQV